VFWEEIKERSIKEKPTVEEKSKKAKAGKGKKKRLGG
jgi:ribosomal protein S21